MGLIDLLIIYGDITIEYQVQCVWYKAKFWYKGNFYDYSQMIMPCLSLLVYPNYGYHHHHNNMVINSKLAFTVCVKHYYAKCIFYYFI